jgi:hypothetical protein
MGAMCSREVEEAMAIEQQKLMRRKKGVAGSKEGESHNC